MTKKKRKKRKYSKTGALATVAHDHSSVILFFSLITAVAYKRVNLPQR